ncbi:unnamed protein product [Caenorhabditis sp. 36 PRJEB53466]|nr:unnamed protein product [Caenorhabditis sp. 36 PRJEB53466]
MIAAAAAATAAAPTMKHFLGTEVAQDIYRCRVCPNEYNIRNGWSSLRRHFKKNHSIDYQNILDQDIRPVFRRNNSDYNGLRSKPLLGAQIHPIDS